jgi:hypothetical protein
MWMARARIRTSGWISEASWGALCAGLETRTTAGLETGATDWIVLIK